MAVGPGELKNGTEYEGNGDTTVAIGSHGDNGANYSGGNLNGLSPGNTETQGHSGEDRFTATGRKITKIHGVDTVEINGEIFIESKNGGILTEKTNSGRYKSQPLSIIEKDLQKTSQSLFGSPPSDSLYQQYYQALQDDLSPDEVRQRLASSPDEMSRLKSAISDIQGREATDGDMPWISAQQSLLGNGSTTLQDIYKGTAAWTADHGGYDQIFEQIHGRAPTAEDRSYAATRIGDGWSVHTYRWNEAHSDDTKFTLSRIIEQVQNRQVTPGDSAWITGQQDDIGNSKQNMNDIRPALAKWSADHGAYDDVFKQVHGRSPSQADRDYAAARIGSNWSVQDYRWNEAHSDDVSIQLTNILSDSSLNKDVSLINNEIIKIQDDIGNNKISFDRASFLIKLGADLSTISNNTRPGDYTPVNSHKPGSYIYTSGSGKQFWVTSEYSFKDIVNNAKSSPPQREYKAFYDAIKSAVGHGGLYDAQRNSVNHVLYSENIDNANYNVGVWCAAYGMSEFEMNFLGDIYIYKTANSFTAAAATEARDLPLWNEGYKDYSTGYIK